MYQLFGLWNNGDEHVEINFMDLAQINSSK